jgi:hypothetical protein
MDPEPGGLMGAKGDPVMLIDVEVPPGGGTGVNVPSKLIVSG